ncbi:MAG: BatD family protein [Deltaproteobacteria bacterium]
MRALRLFSILIVCWFAFAAGGRALAQEPKLTARVDRTQIGIGDAAQLILTFEGEKSTPAPNIAVPEGLQVQYVGPSTQVSIVNGTMSASVSHRYLLVPKRPGSFRVGPFSFNINGKTFSAPAFTLEVVAAGAPAASAPSAGGATAQADLQDRIFVTLEASKNTLYLNEKATVTIKLFVNQLSIRDANFPTFDTTGFTTERVGQPKQYQVNRSGLLFNVLEFDLMVFPTRTGKLPLGPASVQCTQIITRPQQTPFPDEFFAQFFGGQDTHRLDIRSNALTIDVLPFPEEGRPAGFQDMVGAFSLNASVTPARVRLGEPVTLTARVTGEGNMKTVTAPTLTDSSGFKTYDPQRTETDQGVTFEQVIVPREMDITQVPAVELAYFDPNAKQYRIARAGPFPLQVQPPLTADATKVVASKEAQAQPPAPEELGSDIVYIKEDPGRWHARNTYLYESPAVAILVVLPLFIVGALWKWGSHRERLRTDTVYARRLRASPKAERGYRTAAAALASGRHQEFYAVISRTLREFLADKCRSSAQTVSADSLTSLSVCAGMEENDRRDIAHLLRRCDDIRYASLSASGDEMQRDLASLRRALDLIAKIHD